MLKRLPLTAADLISVDPEPFKWRMGVRPLNLDQWLLVDENRDAELNEIGAIVDRHRDEIVYCEPDATPACDCLLYTSPSPRDLSTSRMPSSA